LQKKAAGSTATAATATTCGSSPGRIAAGQPHLHQQGRFHDPELDFDRRYAAHHFA
jgi:hypothetical protein